MEYTGKILTKSISRYFKTPQYLILFVSDKCWMKCRHCWFNEEWKNKFATGNNLTFSELEKLSESINKTAFLSITGGEAFLRDDLEEIVRLFTSGKKTRRYQIPTSGYDTDLIVNKTQKILSMNPSIPFRVDVSLDGSEGIHDSIRGVEGGFRRACETIKELNKIRKKHSRFDVGVITTISHFNQNNIEETGNLIREMHDGEWMVNITRGQTRDPVAGNVNIENYKKAGSMIEKWAGSKTFKGHSGHMTAKWLSAKNAVRREIIISILENKCIPGLCTAGSYGGVIYNDGSVYPCELFNEQMGNLKDFDFNLPRLWNSLNADNTRNKIQRAKCLCTQECFLSINFLIQPRTWYSILKKRTQLYV